MSAASTNFKLGVLTIVALLAAIAVAFGLGVHATRREAVEYHTYFDESVQGLDVGAPVKYRGMPIGAVSAIEIAPDHAKVDVTLAIDAPQAARLDLGSVHERLRAQLGTQGITGVKLVDIDFFDPRTNPPPALSFAPAENYIPAAPSLTKMLGDQAGAIAERLPALLDAVTGTMTKLQGILDDVHDAGLPGRLGRALDDLDAAVMLLRTILAHTERARIPEKTAAAIEGLSAAIARVDAMVGRLSEDGGLIASTERAAESAREIGRASSGAAQELERTLRDLDEAARAIRDLAQGIERDPDMLIKGRAR